MLSFPKYPREKSQLGKHFTNYDTYNMKYSHSLNIYFNQDGLEKDARKGLMVPMSNWYWRMKHMYLFVYSNVEEAGKKAYGHILSIDYDKPYDLELDPFSASPNEIIEARKQLRPEWSKYHPYCKYYDGYFRHDYLEEGLKKAINEEALTHPPVPPPLRYAYG